MKKNIKQTEHETIIWLTAKGLEIIQVSLIDSIKKYTDNTDLGCRREVNKLRELLKAIDDFMRYENKLEYRHVIEISVKEI